MLKSSDMGGSRLMHSPTRLANGEGDVRATGDRHVYNSAINGRILITNVMIDRSPLLLVNVRHVEILLCDGSRRLNIFKNIQNRVVIEQLFNLRFDVHGQDTRVEVIVHIDAEERSNTFPIRDIIVVDQLLLKPSNTGSIVASNDKVIDFTTDKHKFLSSFVEVKEDTLVTFKLLESS